MESQEDRTHSTSGFENDFVELLTKVINPGRCCACGACTGICPTDVIGFEEGAMEKDRNRCINCHGCLRVCPRLEKFDFRPHGTSWNDLVGGYVRVYHAAAVNKLSGVITEILVGLLEEGEIDGALVTHATPNWNPYPILARTADEIRKGAGSKYTNSPVMQILTHAIRKEKMKQLAVVGVPCQIESVARIRNSVLRSMARSIRLAISLYCTEVFHYRVIDELISKKYHVKPEEIDYFRIKRKLRIFRDSEVLRIPLTEMKPWMLVGCAICTDYAGEHSDLSAGNVGLPDNCTQLIARTEIGNHAIELALKRGLITPLNLGNGDELRHVKKMAAQKKFDSARYRYILPDQICSLAKTAEEEEECRKESQKA